MRMPSDHEAAHVPYVPSRFFRATHASDETASVLLQVTSDDSLVVGMTPMLRTITERLWMPWEPIKRRLEQAGWKVRETKW